MTQHILQNDNKILQELKHKLNELQLFNSLLVKHLDIEAGKYCQVIKYEKNCLFVIVANGHWATQLRFRIPDLMNQLQQYPLLKNLGGIICKTRPHSSHSKSFKSNSRRIITLTTKSAESILETAKTIKDTKLRAILERIAGHV